MNKMPCCYSRAHIHIDPNPYSPQQRNISPDESAILSPSTACHANCRNLEQKYKQCDRKNRLGHCQASSGDFSKRFPATHARRGGQDFQGFNPGHIMNIRQPVNQHNVPSTLIQCYMGRDNDESYRKWVGDKLLKQLSRHDYQMSLGTVSDEIRLLPGHFNPTRTETTNQTYGKYLDLLPSFPAEYPLPSLQKAHSMKLQVRFKKSNMSDRLPIPDHQFALDPESQVNRDGYYTISSEYGGVHFPEVAGVREWKPYTFQRNPTILGETHGERKCGFTFPLHSNTGLEINRPL